MLTNKIVRMVTDYNYKCKDCHNHTSKCGKYDSYDVWEKSKDLVRFKDLLSDNEKHKLEYLLVQKQNPEDFEMVSRCLLFLLTDPLNQLDSADRQWYRVGEDFYLHGKKKDRFNGDDLTQDEWFNSSLGKIIFFNTKYQIEFFEKMVLIYLDLVKKIIN
ncbi:hypothetical protein N8755_04995 [Alphaproteobacteria bacterium]|nr:hypothetical protein [Alphaproteobacteria bacterium]